MAHPLGRRPRAWYGPDDWIEGDDPVTEMTRVIEKQKVWDDMYRAMSRWQRFRCWLAGELTEPVGTYGGSAG